MTDAVLHMWPQYEVQNSIKSIADLRAIFPDGRAGDLNWCAFSTSGVHGTYRTLDEIEHGDEDFPPYEMRLTVLVIHPRLVCLKYGELAVRNKADADWLRGLASSSVEAFRHSQRGNLTGEKEQK